MSSDRLPNWGGRFDVKPISSTPVIAELDIERNELAQAWKRFIGYLLPEDQVEWENRPATAQDVLALVRNIQTWWVSRPRQRVFGHSMSLCDQLLPTIDTHVALLSALPLSDRYYTPLFFGVLQSVIKASSNYPRVMEGLVTALLNIHSALSVPDDSRLSHRNAVEPIAKIYTLTFFFLTEFMDWYVRQSTCQLLKGHCQDVYAEFHHLIFQIHRQARALPGQTDMAMDEDNQPEPSSSPQVLWEESQLSQVGRQGTDRRIAAQNTITRRLIWEIQQDAEERDRIRQVRDQLLTQMLNSVSQQLQPISEQSSGIVCITTAAPDLVTSQFEWSRGSKRRLARLELQSASKHLQAFFDSDDQIADLEPDIQVIAENSVITSLRQWVTSTRSQALAVGGSQSTVFPSPVALISTCYASFARQARLPVVSHFCALPAQTTPGLNPHEQGLIALTYSIIRQLIDCLPPVVDSDSLLDLSAERFRQLDGTISSWKAALSLVDTLLHFSPPLLICAIDGLDTIEDASTDAGLRDLLRVLLTHTRHQPQADDNQGPVALFKVLFTVAGRPSALVDTMSENHLTLTESNQTDQSASDPVLTSDLGVVMMNA